jgi:allophanate hydrolase subunit 2
MPDCRTVGGYPKIATVISVERGRLAQMRASADFSFERVAVEYAQKLLRREEAGLAEFGAAWRCWPGIWPGVVCYILGIGARPTHGINTLI